MGAAVVKVCVVCGKDVAGVKRVKDLQGRYYCAGCYEGVKAGALPAVAAVAAVPAAEDGLLDLAPVVEVAPVRRTAVVRAPAGAQGFKLGAAPALPEKMISGGGGPVCPCCEKETPAGAKICVGCGIQVPSGKPVITSLGRDEDALYGNAERIIGVISWFFRFGLYPIASEAYAIQKPIVIWVMAVLMTVASVGYYFALRGEPSKATINLMLWPRAQPPKPMLSDEEALAFYHEHEKDKVGKTLRTLAAFEDDEVDGKKLTENEKIVRAYHDIEKEDVPAGEFHWYQLLTNTFLHDPGSIIGLLLHLGGNMLFLLIFGTRVNALIGNVKMAIVYPLLAVLASGAHLLFTRNAEPVPALGASGAIMGLAGMYLIFFPVHRVYMAIWFKLMWRIPTWIKIWPVRGFWVLAFYIAFDVVATLLRSEDGVAHWAHLGGFIAGMGIALVMLIGRMQHARHADLLSVLMGRRAWLLIGKPQKMVRGVVVG